MQFRYLRLSLFVLCLFLPEQLMGEKVHKVAFKTSAVSILNGIYKLYVPLKPIPIKNKSTYQGGWLEVELNTRDSIGGYKVETHGVISFFTMQDATTEPIAEIKMGASTAEVLLLFVPQKEKYRILSLSYKDAPLGSYFIINRTEAPMMANIGGKKQKLANNKQVYFQANGKKSDAVVIRGIEKGKPTTLRETEWALKPTQREIIIYYRDSRSGKIRWKHLMDTAFQEEEP